MCVLSETDSVATITKLQKQYGQSILKQLSKLIFFLDFLQEMPVVICYLKEGEDLYALFGISTVNKTEQQIYGGIL